MNFKSQIATNINQSWKLLNLGLKPCTADMYLEKSKTPEYGEYHLHTICEGIDPEHWFSVRMNRDITPAWSLDRLLELIPKSIKQRHRPNADFDMHSDGFDFRKEFGRGKQCAVNQIPVGQERSL